MLSKLTSAHLARIADQVISERPAPRVDLENIESIIRHHVWDSMEEVKVQCPANPNCTYAECACLSALTTAMVAAIKKRNLQ